MPKKERVIFLISQGEGEARQHRLINATSKLKAIEHILDAKKASAADVARVLGAGGKVEEA